MESTGGVCLRPRSRVEVAGIQPGRGVSDCGINIRATERHKSWAECVGLAHDGGVVSGDNIIAGAGVDQVVAILGAGHIAATDDIVITTPAEGRVIALLSKNDIAAVVTVEQVVGTAAYVTVLRVGSQIAERNICTAGLSIPNAA